MYTKSDLIKQLNAMGLKKTDSIMIHSSMKAIGDVENRALGVIDSLMEYFSEGLLMLPTHTWATMDQENTLFDLDLEESCVGTLTNVFRKQPNVYRSKHPTHSVAVYGKNARDYIDGEEDVMTPGSPKGAWGRLASIGAKILLVGCEHERNTFIHAIEEMVDVPNRIATEGILFTIKSKDETIQRVFHKHHTEGMPHLSENYQKAAELFLEKEIVTIGQLGDAKVLLMDANELMLFVKEMLAIDIDVFSTRDDLDKVMFSHLSKNRL